MNWSDFRKLIVNNLSDDLLTPKYRRAKKGRDLPKTFGHCYVASEVAYYILGGKDAGWTPQFIRYLGQPHWFLKHKSGRILDLTSSQFKTRIDYSKARGVGFLTKDPSKRAKLLLKRIGESKTWANIKKSHGG